MPDPEPGLPPHIRRCGLSIRDARRMQKDAEKAAINRMVALMGA
jgi:hypothetical protein